MRIGENFSISWTKTVPYYRQIARYLRKLLVAGNIREGSRLPGSRELAARLGVHYNTVLKAYRLLRSEALVFMRERLPARIEQTRLEWLGETALYAGGFEIKAAMRQALALGVSIAALQTFVGCVGKEVFEPAEKNPEERVRAIMARNKFYRD